MLFSIHHKLKNYDFLNLRLNFIVRNIANNNSCNFNYSVLSYWLYLNHDDIRSCNKFSIDIKIKVSYNNLSFFKILLLKNKLTANGIRIDYGYSLESI